MLYAGQIHLHHPLHEDQLQLIVIPVILPQIYMNIALVNTKAQLNMIQVKHTRMHSGWP